MILFPNCKINLGLHILSSRRDGFHELQTLMYPLPGLCDALEILLHDSDEVVFTSSGIAIDALPEKNLCLKAYRALQAHYPLGGVRMHLHKVIPPGAGLGGGSADAAFVIRALCEQFSLPATPQQQEEVAAEIGSDTAFFIRNRPAFATGRGEQLVLQSISLSGYQVVVVKPPESVSTAQAYAGVTPITPSVSLLEELQRPIEQWRGRVVNDFELSVFRQLPRLAQIKEQLYAAGALYASLSGSGSALYGIFGAEQHVELSKTDDLFVYQTTIV